MIGEEQKINKEENVSEGRDLADLLSLAKQDASFRHLLIQAEKGQGRSNIFGLQDAQKAYVMAALAQATQRQVVLLAADELKARSMADLLRAFWSDPESIAIYRARELSLTAAEAASLDLERQRMGVLQRFLDGSLQALVVVGPALLQKLQNYQDFAKGRQEIHTGQPLDPGMLERSLIDLGFERVGRVEHAGEFARRGDILDVADLAGAWRLSFFGDEIDVLKRLDMESQRAIENVDRLCIQAVREITPSSFDRAFLMKQIEEQGKAGLYRMRQNAAGAEALRAVESALNRDLDLLGAGVLVPDLDRWISVIYPDAQTVLDYAAVRQPIICVDEVGQLRRRLDAAQAEFSQRVGDLLLKGQTIPQASDVQRLSLDAFRELDAQTLLFSFASLASSGNGFPAAVDRTICGRDAEHFHGQDEKLLSYVKTKAAAGEHVYMLMHTSERKHAIQKLAAEKGLPVKILGQALKDGFCYPAAKLIVLGAQDIFGMERKSRRQKDKNALRLNFFADLQPGDKVVHENNGIGIYQGISNTMDAAGVRRDYLTVLYAQDERLYLPMDQLNQLQKYIGTDAQDIKLSRLGGNDWQKQKDRARNSIKKLAVDLVKLYSARMKQKGHAFPPETIWDQDFADRFPYEETEDQLRCIYEITSDMESAKVMDRLLCGDVGFGKTEVAFRAIFKCVQDGKQAVLLAPTTVLAQQHYRNFMERIGDFPLRVGHLSRFASVAERKRTVRGLKAGLIDVVIGTHRILSKDVSFKNLGLLVIDEEQRFGVDHKERLKALTPTVDVLSLSATPIPRTLHMSMSGIRDISVIEIPPEDRRPVQTYVMEFDEGILEDAILREIAREGQVFYMHNDTRTIRDRAVALEKALPGARVLVAHGRMGERELEDVIAEFVAGAADILVCTTIIESGIDMPRVNTLIVEHADRLGLAQLYQLRGRVGRSDRQAYAYITYTRDKVLTEIAEKRLSAIRDFTELGAGFKIALRDLEVRGAGNLLGGEQHGQLNAIGYDLYTRMLDEEIQFAKAAAASAEGQAAAGGAAGGEFVPASIGKADCHFDIALDAFISDSYIADDGERMDMYRRIAAITDSELYRDVMDELLDRYGNVPRALRSLLDISYARSIAARLGFARISHAKESCILSYASHIRPDMQKLSLLLNLPAYKGKLLFNAGARPFVVLRDVSSDKTLLPSAVQKLFSRFETAEKAELMRQS